MEAKPKADDLLIDYLYGELDDEARASFEQKLAAQPELRRELEQLRGTRELVAGLEELEPPAAATELLMREAAKVSESTLRAEVQGRRPEPLQSSHPSLLTRIHEILRATVMHPAMSTAAALILVLGVGLFVYQRNRLERLTTAPIGAEQWPSSVAAERAPAGDPILSEERRHEGQPGALEKGAEAAASDKAVGRGSYGLAQGKRRLEKKRRRSARSARSARRGKRSRGKAVPRRSMKPEGVASFDDRAGKRLETLSGSGALQAEPSAPARRPASPAPSAAAPSMPAKASRSTGAARSRSYSARPPESRAGSEESEWDEAESDADRAAESRAAAMEWIQRGRRAARAQRCPRALELFERGLAADASLWSSMEADVRRCASTLAEAPQRYPRLARALRRSNAR